MIWGITLILLSIVAVPSVILEQSKAEEFRQTIAPKHGKVASSIELLESD